MHVANAPRTALKNAKLRWQEGYGVLSLRRDEVKSVVRYIDTQESHHSKNNLSDLLETWQIEYDNWQTDEPDILL